MLKKTPLIIGLSFLAQSFAFIIFFILLVTDPKKKRIHFSALAIACGSGALGALFTAMHVIEDLRTIRLAKAVEALNTLEDDEDDDDVITVPIKPYIPVDDTVNEDEFR